MLASGGVLNEAIEKTFKEYVRHSLVGGELKTYMSMSKSEFKKQ